KFKSDNAADNMENLGLVRTDEIKTSSPILNELYDAGKLREDGTVDFTSSDVIPSLEKPVNFNDENIASIQTQDTSQIIPADKGNEEMSPIQEDLLVEEKLCGRLDGPKLIDNPKSLRRSKRLQLKAKRLTNQAKFEQTSCGSNELAVAPPYLDPLYSSEEPLDLELIEADNCDSSGETIHKNKVKRKRSVSDDEGIEYRQAKILKAMLAILELSDSQNDMNIENAFLSETLVSAALVCEDVPIPRSYKQAIADPVYGKMWKKAIDEEIQALTLNQTWEEVFVPTDANLISTKWVFTVKLKPDGTLDRFKARLVARGFTQRFGIDYKETFAPTV
ncbi:hypothetical protein K3495_g15846, partial [Podosphaera aphanis]